MPFHSVIFSTFKHYYGVTFNDCRLSKMLFKVMHLMHLSNKRCPDNEIPCHIVLT